MTKSAEKTIAITPMTPAIGAKVTGVDLAGEMDDDTFAVVHQAVLDHLVLYFPGQDIPPSAQVAFTERFGAVEPHPLKSRAGHPEYEGLLVLVGEPIELVVELMELQRMGPTRELPVPAG